MEVSWEPRRRAATVGRRSARCAGAPRSRSCSRVLALALGSPPRARAASPAGPVRTATPRPPGEPARVGVARELAYLAHAQNPDGGFGGAPGQASSELYTAWAAIGLAAAGRDPRSVRRDGHTVLDALRGEAATLQGAGDLERTILALHACGVSVHSLPASAGRDPVRRLLAIRAGDGSFGDLANLTAFGVFALRAAGYPAGDPVVRAAARWLAAQQDADGGFGFAAARRAGSDVDDTAAALQALVAAGARTGAVAVAREALPAARPEPRRRLPPAARRASNAQSTAWAIQGLIAAGRNPDTVTRAGSRSPLAYLESLLAPDGSVRYSRTGAQTPVWVTAQALTGLRREAPADRARGLNLSGALTRRFSRLLGMSSGHAYTAERPAAASRPHDRGAATPARPARSPSPACACWRSRSCGSPPRSCPPRS